MGNLSSNLMRDLVRSGLVKKAAMAPAPTDPSGMPMAAAMPAPAGGMPPQDPAMMGGAPPMDPAMMGGAPPPMDPAMMGGAPPPMDPAMTGGAMPPMDPAMMGSAPPMDPAMMGGAPPAGGMPQGVSPEMLESILGGMGVPGGTPVPEDTPPVETEKSVETQEKLLKAVEDLADQVQRLRDRLETFENERASAYSALDELADPPKASAEDVGSKPPEEDGETRGMFSKLANKVFGR